MWKFAFPAIKEGMNNRTERIRADLDAAETAKTEAVGVLDGYKAQLADAKAEAGRIIEEARQAADALKKDQEARLQTELAETRARAAADIEAAKAQATADLRGELAQLAVGAASRRRQQEPRPGRPDAAHRGLHQPVGTQLMTDERIARLRRGSARGRPRRGRPGGRRGRAVPLRPPRSRPTTTCAPRSPTSSCR